VRLVDANVLLYAVNPATAYHARARDWLDDALDGPHTVGFAWTVVLAFIRIATNPAIFERPLEPTQACEVVRGWLAQPSAVVVDSTSRHVDVLAGLLTEAGTAGNLVADAHLAALAVEHDATVVSFDTDFARFAGVRWAQPNSIPRR
jgi:toxin-antitoxin system PIN domain toxin